MTHATLVALAEATLPPGRIFPGANDATACKTERFLETLPRVAGQGYGGLLVALDAWSRLQTGSSFAALPPGRRLDVLESWEAVEAGRGAVRALTAPLKLIHFDDPALFRSLGCTYAIAPPPPEKSRWQERVMQAGSLSDGEEIECDVVVVGTGAGGAPVAWELAGRGHAVLLVEEGQLFTRSDFTGRPREMMAKLYRRGGATVAVGNTIIPIPVGRAVGGTTVINSGTCFRVPDKTLAEWRDKQGLHELTPELFAPYYEVVERELEVAPSSPAAVGKPGVLIARGCDALGWSHRPLLRNAPGCDGQGLCCFGCPTDAKKSTNVSFVPGALKRGAQLITGLKIDRVVLDDERAVGVVGRAVDTAGVARTITVRARVVVISCGTLHTPTLLLRQGIANASGQVGRNLSIHPAAAAIGRFDEEVNGWRAVPQGYAIDQFASEGLMFEGGSVPLDLTAASLPGYGPGFVDLVEQFNKLLCFGLMVKDTSRGRVHGTARGEPRISYWMNNHDVAQLRRGLGLLARVYFAAGARDVWLPIAGHRPLRTLADVETFERASLAPRQVEMSAYHPLGTARMGKSALDSVVDLTHETHDVHNLFICDGSAVPGSLGVNPQMTIMAMALRAAEFIDRRLERLSRADLHERRAS